MSTKFINNTACPNQWRVSKATIIKRYISKHKIKSFFKIVELEAVTKLMSIYLNPERLKAVTVSFIENILWLHHTYFKSFYAT